MKTTSIKCGLAVCAAVLAVTAFRASASEAAAIARPEKSFTGTVVAVDPQEHVLKVKNWLMWHKAFNLGDNCACVQLDNPIGTVNELRPGEKVTVSYQDADGIHIADRVEQQPMRFTGIVSAIDPAQHTLILHQASLDKQLQIAANCKIVLRNDNPGTFADIKPGSHVTVTYETPDGTPTARLIAQTSIAFTGRLTAIDLGEKTLKAKALFDSKKFIVADNCAIAINGNTDGKLSDLKPNDRLVFNYDKINGANVVNRIAPAPAEIHTNAAVVTTMPPNDPTGY